MAGGYGIRDGSSIARAIENYARYKEDRRRYELDRQDRLAQRQEISDHRQWQRDSHDEAIQRAEDEKAQAIERRRAFTSSIVGRGASGQGVGVELDDDPENPEFVRASIVTKDGEKRPVTAVPNDNNSAQVKFPKAQAEEIEAHVTHQVNGVLAKGGTEADAEAVGRAALYTNPITGESVIATPEQFEENVKKQGFVKKHKIHETGVRGWASHTDEKISDAVSGAADWAGDKVKGAADHIKQSHKDGGTVGLIKDAASKHPMTKVSETLGDGAKWLYDKFSEAAPEIKRSFFGKDALVEETPEGSIKVKPSQVDPKDPNKMKALSLVRDEVQKRKASGEETPPPSTAVQTVMSAGSPAQKNVALRSQFSATKRQQAAVADMFIHGDIDADAFQNFMDTGDFSLSAEQQQKHFADLNLNARRQRTEIARVNKLQTEMGKITGKNATNEKWDKLFKSYDGILSDQAIIANGGKKYSETTLAKLRNGFRQTVQSMGFSPEQLGSLGGMVTIQNAALSYAHEVSNDEDIVSNSFTSHLNTAIGDLQGYVSQEVLTIAKGVEADPKEVTMMFNAELQALNNETQSEWGDDKDIVIAIMDKVKNQYVAGNSVEE